MLPLLLCLCLDVWVWMCCSECQFWFWFVSFLIVVSVCCFGNYCRVSIWFGVNVGSMCVSELCSDLFVFRISFQNGVCVFRNCIRFIIFPELVFGMWMLSELFSVVMLCPNCFSEWHVARNVFQNGILSELYFWIVCCSKLLSECGFCPNCVSWWGLVRIVFRNVMLFKFDFGPTCCLNCISEWYVV